MSSVLPKSKLQFSIQQLKITIPTWNRLLKRLSKEARTLALFIDEIVRYYKGSQNSHLEYKEILMPHSLSEEERKGFDFKVFVATHSYKKSFANFLSRLNEENQFKECTHHFLIFFYRTIRTVDEIFTLTTGRAWEVVKSYRSFQFPIDMTKRLMDPRFSRMHSRDLVGSTFSTVLQYKGFHERVTESEDIDRITSDSKFSFRENASIYGLGRFKKRTWNVDVGLGSIKINKKFKFEVYFPILDHFSKISRKDTTKTTDLEDEKDDNVGFMFLERMHQVDVELVHALDEALKNKLYEIYSNQLVVPLDFVHRYTEDYFASGKYGIVFGEDNIESFNIPPTATIVMDSVHHHCGVLSKKEFKQKLFGVKLSFLRKGEWFYEPIFKFFEGEVQDKEGGHYFKIGGIWWIVRAEYFILIQQDFQRLLKKCLIDGGKDEARLKKMWLPSKDLAGFSQKELETITKESFDKTKKRLKRKSEDSNLSELSISSMDQGMGILSQTKKRRMIVTSSLPDDLELDELLPESTRNFLESKRKLFKKVKKEGAYNERYLEVDNFIVADRILAQNIELFDLMQITDTHIYLYHVKEGFCQKTRDACSQIRVAAKALRRAKDGDVSKSILEHFWQQAVEQDFEEGTYRDLAKKKLLKLDLNLNPEKAKEIFFNLFSDGKKEVCFVYAFVDDAAKERKLEEEMARVLKFEEKDFDKLEEPKKVYEQLHEMRVLNEGQLDEGFFSKNPYFETLEMDADTKMHVLAIVRKKMSVFESNIAKIELLHLEKEIVNDLGFSFKICQIFRPPGSRSTVFDEIPDFLELDLAPPKVHKSRTFLYGEEEFKILDTLGDGACALHALLGHDVDGTVHYGNGEDAKKEFVEKLKKKDPKIKPLLEDLLIWMLDEGLKKKITQDNVINVIKKGPINLDELRKDPLLIEKEKKKIKRQMGQSIIEIGSSKISGYFNISQDEFKEKITTPIYFFDKVMESKQTFINFLDSLKCSDFDRMRFNSIKKSIQSNKKLENYDRQLRQRKLKSILGRDFLEHYFKCLLNMDYYHYTDELHMAAILFDRKVHFFHKQDGKMVKQVFNEGRSELVLIHHEGVHFSQCKRHVEVDEMDIDVSGEVSSLSSPESGATSAAFQPSDICAFLSKN